jgi:hypothetical protein
MAPPTKTAKPPALALRGNPRLPAQRRQVLAKHYRTKYGVRQKLRGRKP